MNPAFPLLLAVPAPALGGFGAAPEQRAAACARPSPVEDVGLLPPDIPLDEWGMVDQLEVKEGFLAGRAIGEMQIAEPYAVIARATVDAGCEILSGDNQGFEAEIFFG